LYLNIFIYLYQTKTNKMIFKGIEIEVDYEYCAGSIGSWEEPPEHPSIEIEKIMCRNADLTPLFEDLDLLGELEEEILCSL